MLRIYLAAVFVLTATLCFSQTSATNGPDYETWDRLATDIETTLTTTDPSEVYLTRQRENVAAQRAAFSAAQSANANRLATLREQIDALGPAPTDGTTESAEITARRAELQAQFDALSAPRLRAVEAFTRADGIINDIDSRLDALSTDRLLELGPSPLNPAHWPAAVSALTSSLAEAWDGVRVAVTVQRQVDQTRDQLPLIIVLLLVGGLLIVQARKRVAQATRWIEAKETDASRGLTAFLVSLGQILLPLIGVLMVLQAATLTGLFGPRIDALLDQLPWIAFVILAGRWIGNRTFNWNDPASAVLALSEQDHRKGRGLVTIMSILLGLMMAVEVLATFDGYAPEVRSVIAAVFVLSSALILWRLARLMSVAHENLVKANDDLPEPTQTSGFALKRQLGQASLAVALVSSALVLIGYSAAATALMFPFIFTLAVIAVLAIVFEAVRDFYAWVSSDAQAAREGLLPILTNAVILLASIPGLLLIWGMRVSDLTEYWQTFRAGFRVGDTQISPGIFLAFVVAFSIGYFLTRVLQRTLRNTILPKTKMDIGGRTAIVSGFGYVGIFISALIAISFAGLDLSSLAIVAGALSVGIGFGLQNIVSNFVSGIILLIERPISEGDWIEVGPHMGIVKDISVRSTRVETFDRTDVIVPNADLVSGTVTNYTRGNSVGRIIVPIGVAYGNDTRRVEALLQDIAEAHPLILMNPKPFIVFAGFGADSLDFEIRAILRDIGTGMGVKNELRHQIVEKFAEEGIEIPFMQRDIWIKNPEALTGQEK